MPGSTSKVLVTFGQAPGPHPCCCPKCDCTLLLKDHRHSLCAPCRQGRHEGATAR